MDHFKVILPHLGQWSTLEQVSESLREPIKTQIAGPHPRVSDPVGLRAREFAFLTGFPSDAGVTFCGPGAAPLRTTALGIGFWCMTLYPQSIPVLKGEKNQQL